MHDNDVGVAVTVGHGHSAGRPLMSVPDSATVTDRGDTAAKNAPVIDSVVPPGVPTWFGVKDSTVGAANANDVPVDDNPAEVTITTAVLPTPSGATHVMDESFHSDAFSKAHGRPATDTEPAAGVAPTLYPAMVSTVPPLGSRIPGSTPSTAGGSYDHCRCATAENRFTVM